MFTNFLRWSLLSLTHHHTSQDSKDIKNPVAEPPPDHQPVFLGHVRRQWCVRLMAFWPRALSLAIAIRVAFFRGGLRWDNDLQLDIVWEIGIGYLFLTMLIRDYCFRSSVDQVRPEVMMKGVSKSHSRGSSSDCFWRPGKRKSGGWKLPLETNRLSTSKDYGTLERFKFSLVGKVECGIGAMIVLCVNCPSIQSKWFLLA